MQEGCGRLCRDGSFIDYDNLIPTKPPGGMYREGILVYNVISSIGPDYVHRSFDLQTGKEKSN